MGGKTFDVEYMFHLSQCQRCDIFIATHILHQRRDNKVYGAKKNTKHHSDQV